MPIGSFPRDPHRQTGGSERKRFQLTAVSTAAKAWNFLRRWTRKVSVKVTAAILGIMVLILILRAVWEQPEMTIEWTLLQSTVVDPPGYWRKAG